MNYVIRLLFQVTSKVMHYFLIQKEMLLFQISYSSYIVSDVLSNSSGVAMVMY